MCRLALWSLFPGSLGNDSIVKRPTAIVIASCHGGGMSAAQRTEPAGLIEIGIGIEIGIEGHWVREGRSLDVPGAHKQLLSMAHSD